MDGKYLNFSMFLGRVPYLQRHRRDGGRVQQQRERRRRAAGALQAARPPLLRPAGEPRPRAAAAASADSARLEAGARPSRRASHTRGAAAGAPQPAATPSSRSHARGRMTRAEASTAAPAMVAATTARWWFGTTGLRRLRGHTTALHCAMNRRVRMPQFLHAAVPFYIWTSAMIGRSSSDCRPVG